MLVTLAVLLALSFSCGDSQGSASEDAAADTGDANLDADGPGVPDGVGDLDDGDAGTDATADGGGDVARDVPPDEDLTSVDAVDEDAAVDAVDTSGEDAEDATADATDVAEAEPDAEDTADSGDADADAASDAGFDADVVADADADADAADAMDAKPDPEVGDVPDAPPLDLSDLIDADTDGGPSLPVLRLTGQAAGEDVDNDLSVQCHFDATIQDLEETDTGYSGLAIGEVFRTLFPGDGMQEFSAFVVGPATLDYTGEMTVELRWVGDQPDTAKPFWLALEVLDGQETGELTWVGEWECDTLDIESPGFNDTYLVGTGNWELAPDAPPPPR